MTTTNNNDHAELITALQGAIGQLNRMNYTLAIKTTLIRMIDECERLEGLGVDVTNMLSMIQTIFDYTTYITDTPNEVPNA